MDSLVNFWNGFGPDKGLTPRSMDEGYYPSGVGKDWTGNLNWLFDACMQIHGGDTWKA